MMQRQLLLLILLAFSMLTGGCSKSLPAYHRSTADLMIHYGCPACHVIPGIPGAVGKVGPSLASLAQRSYLAGILPNTPGNLERWVMHPQRFQPGIAMPEMGVSPEDARQIATFLETTH
jgi:cytochrome c2